MTTMRCSDKSRLVLLIWVVLIQSKSHYIFQMKKPILFKLTLTKWTSKIYFMIHSNNITFNHLVYLSQPAEICRYYGKRKLFPMSYEFSINVSFVILEINNDAGNCYSLFYCYLFWVMPICPCYQMENNQIPIKISYYRIISKS